MLVFRKGQPST